jgi:hypothetical protein
MLNLTSPRHISTLTDPVGSFARKERPYPDGARPGQIDPKQA